MQKVVVDSDIIIDYIRQESGPFIELVNLSAQKKVRLFISGIVVAELIAGQETRHSDRLEALEQLMGMAEFVPMDYVLSKSAGILVRDFKPIAISDAIVAATALSLNAKLATRNKKHFQGITGLKFYSPR